MSHLFDDIRPYNDAEMRKALQRIAASCEFEKVAAYLYPSVPIEEVRQQFASINTIDQLQETVMYDLTTRIIENTITRLTYSGIELLNPGQNYLFISNHRDIVLDANLLVYILHQHHFPPTQVSFGANLMTHPVLADIGMCNRMFKVVRDGSPKEFYYSIVRVSQYIHYVLTSYKESVWIAQRNGRTKDGNDHTEVALVKMLGLYDGRIAASTYESLHIVPVTVSYEWEPCDLLKVREMCLTSQQGRYVKQSGEDFASILTGIGSPKGHVHITINKPVSAGDLDRLPRGGSAYASSLAQLLTNRIREGYRLMPTNYVAYDLLHGGEKYIDRYTSDQRSLYLERMAQLQPVDGINFAIIQQQFLSLYANPVEW